jgi:hypothetical protein
MPVTEMLNIVAVVAASSAYVVQRYFLYEQNLSLDYN